MKSLSTILLLILFNFATSAQEHIKEADLIFKLPNKHWKFKERQEQGTKVVYTYKRDFILDSAGRQIDPQISFILEPVDSSMDVISYSFQKRSQVPFDVVSMFSHEDGTMKFKNGIGYRGKYNDRGLEHRIYIVHGIYKSMGIMLIMDTTEEIAETVAPEFLKFLSTFDRKKN